MEREHAANGERTHGEQRKSTQRTMIKHIEKQRENTQRTE